MGSVGNNTTTATTRELTDDEMNASLSAEFELINKGIEKFLTGKYSTLADALDEYKNSDFEQMADTVDNAEHIERYTVKELASNYLKEFNANVENYGDGFTYWDSDDVVYVAYKNGTGIILDANEWDGSKKIPLTGIDTIIVNGGWGYGVAGKNATIINMRDYGRYSYDYKNVKQRYEDWNDLRVEFKEEPKWRKK